MGTIGPGSSPKWPSAAGPECSVVLCRGCCCGSGRKHPGVDHDGQVLRLTELLGALATVRTSDCLGHCGYSNIAVVMPTRSARRRGICAVWLGWILDDTAIEAIAHWIQGGGPGYAEPPAALSLHEFTPPKPRRAARR